MKWSNVVAAALVLLTTTRLAHARHLWDEPDGPAYSDELVDRPLVMLAGMTELAIAGALHDHDVPRFVDDTPDVFASHAFGPVEIDVGFGERASLALAIATGGLPAAIVIGAQTSAPASDKTMFVSQYLTADHKLVVVPHELAFVVGAGGSYNEEHIHAPGLQWVRVVAVDVSAQAEIQLASTLAVFAGASIGYPVSASNQLQFQAQFDARAGLSLTIGNTWELYTTGTLADDNGTAVLALGAGVEKRFGP
ncbi:MAG TPA: hypothetical protein VFQ65_11150 [Kofleriaceae bacterium]|nr:hypothetical protein [Kofleriaceae bacterium]